MIYLRDFPFYISKIKEEHGRVIILIIIDRNKIRKHKIIITRDI